MPSTSSLERSTIAKVAWRLVPFVALMFFINYLDRTAIGFAGPNGMNDDLDLDAAQFGFASGVFFVGYILLEIPSNLALHRFGARRWLARIMVTWGLVSLLFTWVSGFEQLVVLRVLLGIAEAGFFPGAILFLSLWVPSRHRPLIIATFYLAQPLTTVIGAPIAGLILQQDGVLFGLEGWRLMFLLVSLPAILVGVLAWFVLADSPKDARWLSPDQRAWLEDALAADRASASQAAGARPTGGLRHAFASGRVWLCACILFSFVYGLYALAFFLPTIIEGFQTQAGTEFGLVERGLVTAIPYLPAAVALWLWSRDATRRGVRWWHIAVPSFVGAVSVPLALLANSPAATIAIITVTACAIFAGMPNLWSVPTRFLTGAQAAAGIALINTVGNLAGFSAPFITGAIAERTGGYVVPMAIVGGVLALGGVAMLALVRVGAVQRPQPAPVEVA